MPKFVSFLTGVGGNHLVMFSTGKGAIVLDKKTGSLEREINYFNDYSYRLVVFSFNFIASF